jgi:hypothetical protein
MMTAANLFYHVDQVLSWACTGVLLVFFANPYS